MHSCLLLLVSCYFKELADDKRQECHGAGKFYRLGKTALMARAGAVSFRRINFSLRVHETAQKIGVFVINRVDMLVAEMAEFLHKTGDR